MNRQAYVQTVELMELQHIHNTTLIDEEHLNIVQWFWGDMVDLLTVTVRWIGHCQKVRLTCTVLMDFG